MNIRPVHLGVATSLISTIPVFAQPGLTELRHDNDTTLLAAVSRDGSTFVGRYESSTIGSRAFRWKPLVGWTDICQGKATATNADGSVVVGQSGTLAFRWTASNGFNSLGPATYNGSTPGSTDAFAVSDDGSIVVGNSGYPGCSWGCYGNFRGVVWSAATQSWWNPPGRIVSTNTVTGMGNWILGGETSYGGNYLTQVSRWPMLGGQNLVGFVPGGCNSYNQFNTYVACANIDGTVLGGNTENWCGGMNAFRWTPSTGFHVIARGAYPAFTGVLSMTSDGSKMVGGHLDRAFIWTSESGLQFLEDYLTQCGTDISGWTLRNARSISGDGRIIIGDGIRDGRSASWILGDCSASIVTQPSDNLATPSTDVLLQVVAQSATTFQWRRNGVPVSESTRYQGVTTPQLIILGLQNNDQGLWDCVISAEFPCGGVQTRLATVSCRPIVSANPVGGSYFGGQSINLSASIQTSGITTYRWKKDGINIYNSVLYSGVTTPHLQINAEDPTQSGVYTLTSTNSCGAETTIGAEVVVRCLADFNRDDSVDGDDVIDFFHAWDIGSAFGDINMDGGIDGDDVIRLFERWDRGC